MKKKSIWILILFCCTMSFSHAQRQTISGKISDSQNGETLFGVNIIIKELKIGAVSNEYGFYSLSIPKGNYTVIYSYLGFKTVEKQINLERDISINIELDEDTTALDEVIVSEAGGKIRAKLRQPQMSVNQLSVKTIKQAPVVLGETDILKTITLLPGVTNAGEGASGFNVRGGATDQNLVLLDETTIYNTSHLFGFFSVFNADAIKDVKLYKGGIPAKFGSRVSSVLDVRQKDGNNKEFHLNGGIGIISSRLMAEGPIKKEKGSFLIAGRTSYANLFLKLANEKNNISFYDLNTKLSYELNENNRLYLSGYFGKDAFGFDQFLQASYGNTSFNLRWNHLFNKKLFSNLSLIYSKYDYKLGFKSIGFDWISSIKNYNIKYDFNYYVNNNLKLNFGVNGNYYNFNPGEIVATKENSIFKDNKLDGKQAFEPAAYLEAEQNLGSKLSVRYGLRVSSFFRLGNQVLNTYTNNQPVIYNSELGVYESANPFSYETYDKGKVMASFIGYEPRLSLSYKLNDETSIKASFQHINQYLHLISNTNAPSPLDIWTPSGKYIKPQKSNQYAVGFFKNFKEEKYSLEIESYYKTVDNRIDYIDGADLIANNTIETEILQGESRAYGLEFLLQKNTGKLTGWLSYTYSKSQQRVQGRDASEPGINDGDWYNTAYDRTHDISLTGSYKLNKKWRFGGNFIFQTGRPTNYPSGQYQLQGFNIPVFTTRNKERLPAYHRLDISATLTPKKNKNRKWKGEWVFGIYNLYGRQNAASIAFRQNEDTLLNEAVQTSIFGIMPAITYNFKF